MKLLTGQEVMGDQISMRRTDIRHFDQSGKIGSPLAPPSRTFGNVLTEAIDGVNQQQQVAADLSTQMIIDPESVDVHDVTIAMAKANMALSITKEVVDRGVKAYQDIINLR